MSEKCNLNKSKTITDIQEKNIAVAKKIARAAPYGLPE